MKDKTTLEYERRIAANAEKAKRLAESAKALQKEAQRLKRNARTHHLCNLGGMLETYLKEPDLLDEDDVRRILDGVFADKKVQLALDRLLEQKRGQASVEEYTIPVYEGDESEETEIT